MLYEYVSASVCHYFNPSRVQSTVTSVLVCLSCLLTYHATCPNFVEFSLHVTCYLQCFDTVGWAAGRASSL